MQLATSNSIPRIRCGSAKYNTVTMGKKTANWRELKSTALVVMLGLLGSVRLPAQTDSASAGSLFTYRDAFLLGAFAATALAVRPLDDHYADRLQDSSTQDSRNLHRIAQFVRTTTAPG